MQYLPLLTQFLYPAIAAGSLLASAPLLVSSFLGGKFKASKFILSGAVFSVSLAVFLDFASNQSQLVLAHIS